MSSRLHRAITAAPLLVVAGLGPASAEELLLNVKAPSAEPAPETAPPSIDLGGGFIEFLLTGRVPPPRSDAAPVQAAVPVAQVQATPVQATQVQAPSTPSDGDVAIVDYSGPFEPGSVILNVTKNIVYRILPDGKMAIHKNDSSQIKLARSILKQTGR